MTPGELVFGLVTATTTAVTFWLGHKRGVRVDRISEQTGMATNERAGRAQEFEHLSALLDIYQEDARNARVQWRDVREQLTAMEAIADAAIAERDACYKLIRQLRLKYGDENGMPPV